MQSMEIESNPREEEILTQFAVMLNIPINTGIKTIPKTSAINIRNIKIMFCKIISEESPLSQFVARPFLGFLTC